MRRNNGEKFSIRTRPLQPQNELVCDECCGMLGKRVWLTGDTELPSAQWRFFCCLECAQAWCYAHSDRASRLPPQLPHPSELREMQRAWGKA